MNVICNACNEVDTRMTNGDCEGCCACGAIEQGFIYCEEDGDFLVDEDGFILDEDNNYEKIACILD
jgi:hypothetical protein